MDEGEQWRLEYFSKGAQKPCAAESFGSRNEAMETAKKILSASYAVLQPNDNMCLMRDNNTGVKVCIQKVPLTLCRHQKRTIV